MELRVLWLGARLGLIKRDRFETIVQNRYEHWREVRRYSHQIDWQHVPIRPTIHPCVWYVLTYALAFGCVTQWIT